MRAAQGHQQPGICSWCLWLLWKSWRSASQPKATAGCCCFRPRNQSCGWIQCWALSAQAGFNHILRAVCGHIRRYLRAQCQPALQCKALRSQEVPSVIHPSHLSLYRPKMHVPKMHGPENSESEFIGHEASSFCQLNPWLMCTRQPLLGCVRRAHSA